VRECLVCVGHAVGVVALLDRRALAVERVEQLPASLSAIVFPERERADEISQRIASETRRSPLISTGTW
jgi:hypothetical protein